MLANKALTLLASLASTTSALPFHLINFHPSDTRIASESHALAFTISDPDAVSEQGGSAAANCTISSTSTPPTCWTSCGAYNFTLEVQESSAYRNSMLNNVSIPVVEDVGDYGCSRRGQSTQYNFRISDSSFDTVFETFYGVENGGTALSGRR